MPRTQKIADAQPPRASTPPPGIVRIRTAARAGKRPGLPRGGDGVADAVLDEAGVNRDGGG
jgi:hypothetical protein